VVFTGGRDQEACGGTGAKRGGGAAARRRRSSNPAAEEKQSSRDQEELRPWKGGVAEAGHEPGGGASPYRR
jgi:hypothetical protein